MSASPLTIEELAREIVARSITALAVPEAVLTSAMIRRAEGMVERLAALHLDDQTLQAAAVYSIVRSTGCDDTTSDPAVRTLVSQAMQATQSIPRILMVERSQDNNKHLRMFLAIASDIRAVLICLTERQYELDQTNELPPEQRRALAEEALELQAPLASRLGIWSIKSALEDSTFRILEPETYAEIARQLNELIRDRAEYLETVASRLRDELRAHGIDGNVSGRAKHLHSIWQKMVTQNRRFDQVYDILAVRVLVDSVRDCYSVMGLVHALWRPVPGRIKDYIAMPRNMYQSLHTTVICEGDIPTEIQIRTYQMHEVAEYGYAAHWRYKESRYGRTATRDSLDSQSWQHGLDAARRQLNSGGPADLSKINFGQELIYVFSPKGTIIELPVGSTPVDFAYHIHSEVGHSCNGARVNNRIVPLDQHLKSGDVVEIMTSKVARGPSRDWLNFVRTSAARNHIRRYFKRLEREVNVAAGRDLLEKELRRLGLHVSFDQIVAIYGISSIEVLFEKIGAGDMTARQVAQKVVSQLAPAEPVDEKPALPALPAPSPLRSSSGTVAVHGVDGILTRLARCCSPVLGDPIIGYVTRGKGVTVHRADCRTIRGERDRERLIEVTWGSTPGAIYVVPISVQAWDRVGLWRDVTGTIKDSAINIHALHQEQKTRQGRVVLQLQVEIASLSQLTTLLDKINRIPGVIEARREHSSVAA